MSRNSYFYHWLYLIFSPYVIKSIGRKFQEYQIHLPGFVFIDNDHLTSSQFTMDIPELRFNMEQYVFIRCQIGTKLILFFYCLAHLEFGHC